MKYSLHTKIVLTVTIVLLYLFERENILAGGGATEQILCSFFGSVTARTAGFNTVDAASLKEDWMKGL